MTADLCDICQEIVKAACGRITFVKEEGQSESNYYSRKGPFHHVEAWREFAHTESCQLCTLLFHSYDERIDIITSKASYIRGIEWRVHQWGLHACRIELDVSWADWSQREHISKPVVHVTFIRESEGFSPDSTLSTDPWPSTWSITSLGRIKDWLASCLADHSDCRQASQLLRAHVSQPDGYPSRLIDVDPDLSLSSLPPGTRDSLDTRYSVRDNPWVCIRNTRQLPSQQAPYATLSHRWSGSPSLLLTKANATVLSHAIPREALLAPDSQAIAEAIEVTRALGIPYLWVDSLCITQDDGPEKQAEIARMDKVYLGSHLNISATASSSGSGGLFRSRNPSSVKPLVRTYDVPQAHRRELTGTFVIHVDRWTKSVANAPLNNRGWVFQERALAPRIIHFAHDQVYWECYAGGISECFASPEASDSGTFKSDIVSLNRQNWYKIVNAYSPTDVTFAEDKLTAMSAVARVAGGLLGYADGDYLAGLWRPELVPTLYWNAWHPSPRRAASYRAPSWSWASMDTRCMMTDGSLRLQPAVEVVDVDLQMKRGYRYGEASSGYLLVKGSVWKGRSLVASREEGALFSSPLGLGEDFQVINFFRSSTFHMHRRYETRRTGLTLIIRWDDAELDSFVGDVFFLALSTRLPENGRAMVDYSMCAGLLLQRSGVEGEYERVGSFEHSWYGSSTTDLILSARRAELAPQDYIGSAEDGSYIIKVV